VRLGASILPAYALSMISQAGKCFAASTAKRCSTDG
jgi:hypothetical protein